MVNTRRFGKTGWLVSEIGYGMWGMGSWSGSDDSASLQALQLALDLGCNFFDTAWAYGAGRSENLLGKLVRANPGVRVYTATKVPPKNSKWPARSEYGLDDSYPPEHVHEYVQRSLKNSGLERFDLLQLHTWDDSWVDDPRWIQGLHELKQAGVINAVGISINRWEPWNGIRAVRSGMIDAVQVVYNIFDQNPEDELFPACQEMDVAVIARVPFDEGTLTGNLSLDSQWPEGDWRNSYFSPANLKASVDRAELLKELLPDGMRMPDMALRFILNHPAVSTIIPGMRKTQHVEANLACSEAGPLPETLHLQLRQHRWVRTPATVHQNK